MRSSEEIIKEIGDLRREMGAKIGDLRKELQESRKAEMGLVSGETVVVDENGDRYLFHRVDEGFPDWISGHKFKKDGTPGKQSRNLYSDWRVEQ